MPELPEIEQLRRTLEPGLVGRRISRVDLRRADIVRDGSSRSAVGRVVRGDLLGGDRVIGLDRRGKELAILGSSGRILVVHLGMSGRLTLGAADRGWEADRHDHCVWTIHREDGGGRMVFRDPRRFGGLWPFSSVEDLAARRWSRLGPDALRIGVGELRSAFSGTERAVKAVILDQRVLAGVGNIYADESLFRAGLHPERRSSGLDDAEVRRLASCIRSVLGRAVSAGGSTLRDYRDSNGDPGAFVAEHHVYGRGGEPCVSCGSVLESLTVSQRTTTFCPQCQPVDSD